ncbi:hypothetical protein BZA05DRAFT_410014 [Tricharina praecox]|uniref:uncharacterized protein n=1 Tax=Tricharina praecox TaxID=43433 RepID=UPI0022201EF2|nr:uncharacterized protein BZA05DRAFT_410014 [Tricharina praecox]KAI5844128.1 hypothetical protein BZA05DRAFT_410014 [Tricharina praecox]
MFFLLSFLFLLTLLQNLRRDDGIWARGWWWWVGGWWCWMLIPAGGLAAMVRKSDKRTHSPPSPTPTGDNSTFSR